MDLKILNKDNISAKQSGNLYILKSLFLRYRLIRDLMLLPAIIFLWAIPESNIYLFLSLSASVVFIYFLWEDIKSINNLEINTDDHTLRIKHLNFIRYLILHKWDGYKKLYRFNEIESFTVIDKWSLNVYDKKYFIAINLKEGHGFILLDTPNEAHANSISDFLNEITKTE